MAWIRGAVENAEGALSRLTFAPLPPKGKLTFTTDLLAMANAAVALWVGFAVSARYLNGPKSAVGLAFLTLVPFFNFLALKFNANSAMMPWWALTTWFFLRSFESDVE